MNWQYQVQQLSSQLYCSVSINISDTTNCPIRFNCSHLHIYLFEPTSFWWNVGCTSTTWLSSVHSGTQIRQTHTFMWNWVVGCLQAVTATMSHGLFGTRCRFEQRKLAAKCLPCILAKNYWKSVMEINRKCRSRHVMAQFVPRHILSTNEIRSKFKTTGRCREQIFFL